MPQKINDTGLRLVGISLLSTLLFLANDQFKLPLTKQGVALILFRLVSVAAIWHLNRAITVYVRYTFLPRATVITRIGITLLFCTLATTLFAWAFDALRYALSNGTLANFRTNERPVYISLGSHKFEMTSYGIDFFHANFTAVFYVTIYELLFYRHDSSRYQQELALSEQEREKLRVANLQSQFDVLKQQVNPHFLFNSLNSLSSLISEDPKQAEVFVDKLSGVYRYVLRANRGDGPEQHLTTLAAELAFMEAYYHLLQTRYGTGLSLTVDVHERQRSCQIPPLTLQLLVENAVKHNVVSTKRPLSISIATDEQGRLVVQNTLQRKTTRVLSNGVGLANIVAKYQMLNLAQLSIEESQDYFTVRLPLLSCPDGENPRQFLEP